MKEKESKGGRLGGMVKISHSEFRPAKDMPIALDGKMTATGSNNHRKDHSSVKSPAKYGNSI